MSSVAIALFTAIFAAHSVPRTQDDCRYSAERNATLDAAGARLFQIDAGAGGLKIVGRPGLRQVQIRGHACASSQKDLESIRLDTRRDGSTLVVRANIHDEEDDDHWGNHYRTLDVVVEVPEGMAADIADGSGEMELHGLGDVEIEDGSGSIVADNIGSARIRDGSGSITLSNVHGNITIRDGSGSIDVRKVSGNFTVESKGSGSVDYEDVSGRVDVPTRRRHRGY